jgi:predicted DCC family thiol-disulfide oxidoreductase YuxK
MLDFDNPEKAKGKFRFAALQSEVGRALLQRGGRSPDDLSSIVLSTKEGNTYTESEAILRIGQVGVARGCWGCTHLALYLAAIVDASLSLESRIC